MKRRIVITGFGIMSSIGNNSDEVLKSLLEKRSGVVFMPEWKTIGSKSQICGSIKNFNIDESRQRIGLASRYMDVSSLYALLSSMQAVGMSELPVELLRSDRAACIVGSGIGDSDPIQRAAIRILGIQNDLARKKNKGTPYDVTRCMSSGCSANLTNYYGIRGRSYSISSACATSLHCLVAACDLVADNRCDIVMAGGAEDASAIMAVIFDNMRLAISKNFNHQPQKASRPYDRHRDGFVISGGGGIVIIEDLEHARKRKAPVYAEILGCGATSDGHDIILPHPDGDGALRCIDQALEAAGCAPHEIDYINTHATSTPAGDLAEAKAIRKRFSGCKVPLSSTKSLTGHGIGAAGVQELIYCLLMLHNRFIAASVNIDELDPQFEGLNIITENRDAKLKTILTNSFGFGGTNASLIIRNYTN